MLLAEGAASGAGVFTGFDIFMLLFTLLLVIAFFRGVTAEEKNKFAIGFTGISLAVFLFLDVVMVLGWFGMI